ncbi:hypothetical protein [Streptomyces erythrochromogenes]|uniref:hypothetical protein n=1 Tax=Streptomyces erythrochromogenes TaxID=285574 RepID=UPI0038633820|nr:hypothetical protein OG489_00470 [Streptomyces erythrochromogenes]WSR88274.1 hypothetical protein OG489_39490 [Streptomyces erythrochromogenes]
MSTSPSVHQPAPAPDAPASALELASSARLGAAEAAIVIAAITSVTVLAILERPVPAVLATLAAATVILLLPGRAPHPLDALTELLGGRQ